MEETEPDERHQSFQGFFQCWKAKQGSDGDCRAGPTVDVRAAHLMIDRIILHYFLYNKSKSTWSNYNLTSTFVLPCLNILQGGPLSSWVGGWQPAVAFHVLYSKSGFQMENRLMEIVSGLEIGDLGDLTESQLHCLDALHEEVLKEEESIIDNLKRVHDESVDSQRQVARIVTMADGLRMSTLDKMDDILTPLQRTHFRASGEEMELRIHDWARHGRVADSQSPLA